jgi:hypothetical protein
MLLLYNTTDELVPLFHEYWMFCPFITEVVMSDTVPLQASVGVTGAPAPLTGGAVLTNMVAEPVEVPPAGQEVFPIEDIVYTCDPPAAGVTITFAGLPDVVPV